MMLNYSLFILLLLPNIQPVIRSVFYVPRSVFLPPATGKLFLSFSCKSVLYYDKKQIPRNRTVSGDFYTKISGRFFNLPFSLFISCFSMPWVYGYGSAFCSSSKALPS